MTTDAGHPFAVRRASERGTGGTDWLDSRHTFSFASYADPAWMGYRSLRVINEDIVLPARGFGRHGHRDMEILSWVLSGRLEHQDSTGGGGVIAPGMAQFMSAGSGVEHSEMNPSPNEPVHFLQVWIRPAERGGAPLYAQRDFTAAVNGRFAVLASADGQDQSFRMRQDARILVGRFAAGQSVIMPVPVGRHAWVQVALGEIDLAGQALSAGDGAFGTVERPATLSARSAAEVMLFDLA